ncbi:MAG: deoxynucleoside kinase [Saprospirales bacterium]|nr:MAG: deoxynucleoside kinase [Saprospirales bacterium]
MSFPYRFIAIEGNIGTGKTTLCKLLQKQTDAELILEQFTDNPFLENFYENPERFGLQVELFFLSERYKQLKGHEVHSTLFADRLYISDYIFIKSLLFASRNLKGNELNLYHRIFEALHMHLPHPDIIFYIHRTAEELLQLISERNRAYEQDIKSTYLERIQSAYFDYFKSMAEIPVVIIDGEGLDYANKEEDFEYLVEIMSKPYVKGNHFISHKKNTFFD